MFNFFKKKPNFSGPFNLPEERVQAFVDHWYAQWSTAQKAMGHKVDFDYWGKLVNEVDSTHFATGSSSNTAGAYGSQPTFGGASQQITKSESSESKAQVFAELREPAVSMTQYHVFDLERRSDNDWRITKVHELLDPPHEAVVDANAVTEALAMGMASAPPMNIQDNLSLDENVVFNGNRTVDIANLGEGKVRMTDIGTLHIRSGVLAILDFGYTIRNLEPLQQTVVTGEYPVQVVTVNDRVAALRVRFDIDRKSVRWQAANTPSGNGIYGVDAGNLAVFDVEALSGLTHLKKETVFDEWARTNVPSTVSLTGDNDCVITSSGFGDGAYPALWGFADNDQLVSLYLDFMILLEERDDGVLASI
ncbi:MAG: DUF4241 domain-containing protein [Pseudomonadota bacterium]